MYIELNWLFSLHWERARISTWVIQITKVSNSERGCYARRYSSMSVLWIISWKCRLCYARKYFVKTALETTGWKCRLACNSHLNLQPKDADNQPFSHVLSISFLVLFPFSLPRKKKVHVKKLIIPSLRITNFRDLNHSSWNSFSLPRREKSQLNSMYIELNWVKLFKLLIFVKQLANFIFTVFILL